MRGAVIPGRANDVERLIEGDEGAFSIGFWRFADGGRFGHPVACGRMDEFRVENGFSFRLHDVGQRGEADFSESEIGRYDEGGMGIIVRRALIIFTGDVERAVRAWGDGFGTGDTGAFQGLCEALSGLSRFEIDIEFTADEEGICRVRARAKYGIDDVLRGDPCFIGIHHDSL